MEQQVGILRAQLARKTGCNLETIRYYEKVGLLPGPPRSSNGYRVYSPELVQRLQFILRARDLGYAMDEIRSCCRSPIPVHKPARRLWREPNSTLKMSAAALQICRR